MKRQPQNKKNYRSLKAVILSAFIALNVTILAFSNILDMYKNFGIQRDLIESRQLVIAHKAADTVRMFVENKIQALEKLIFLTDLANAEPDIAASALNRLIGREETFRNLVLLGADRNELLRASRVSRAVSISTVKLDTDDIILKAGEDGRYVGPVYFNEMTYEPMVIVAVPVADVFVEYKGILAAELNLKFMWDLVDGMKVGDDGVAYVVDRDGRLLAYRDMSRVLKGENLSHLSVVAEFIKGASTSGMNRVDVTKGVTGKDVVANSVFLGRPDWAVIVETPVAEAYKPLREGIAVSLVIMLFSILLAVLAGFFVSDSITAPLIKLRDATKKISAGNLDLKTGVESADEIGDLAESFDHMIEALRNTTVSRDKLLEEVTERRKAEELLKNAQGQLVQAEKMAAIGQLAAGVAHEINNPMGFIISNLHVLKKYLGRMFDIFSALDREFVKERFEAMKQTARLAYMEKDVPILLNETLEGADRVKNIVASLKDFAHPGQDQLTAVDINSEIEKSLMLVWNELKYHCEVEKHLGDVPDVLANGGQLGQVFVNLLVNAAHATEGKKGKIVIKTCKTSSDVRLEFSDNGKGIPEENLSKIFEPFFTTKEVGKGTGLGLSLVYSIVQNHHWTIEVESEVDKGTSFIIKIPLNGGGIWTGTV